MPSGLAAIGDERLLRIALDALLGNAWKFSGKVENPTVEFGSQVIDGEDTYFVRDNGAGFDAAYATRLFAPFQRLHSEEDFAGQGNGARHRPADRRPPWRTRLGDRRRGERRDGVLHPRARARGSLVRRLRRRDVAIVNRIGREALAADRRGKRH